MSRPITSRAFVSALAVSCLAGAAQAQFGYGVNASGMLFRFRLSDPATAPVTIGPLGFVPEGIDFRPGFSLLYAVDVGPVQTQMYSINVHNGAVNLVGPGFPSAGPGYNLGGGQTFGFDFNPVTLQADSSMRIRLVASGGSNLRLNSGTGLISNVDTPLTYPGGLPIPGVDAAAYINSADARTSGATALYVMDATNNQLVLQAPPNDGALTAVGPFGVGINNTLPGIGFAILTNGASVDPGIGGDTGYAVLRRPDAPLGGPLGAYVLYQVNLATGALSGGALVGGSGNPADFTGGFAVIIPTPGAGLLFGLAALGAARRRRR